MRAAINGLEVFLYATACLKHKEDLQLTMNDNRHSLDVELDETFRRMIRKFVVERDKVIIKGEISPPQLVVLGKLYKDGPQKAGVLSEELDFSPGATTALCDKLVDSGYVYRTRPESDRRIVLLHITEKGADFCNQLHSSSPDSRDFLFHDFTEEEKLTMLELCGRVLDKLPNYSDVLNQQFNRIFKEVIAIERE